MQLTHFLRDKHGIFQPVILIPVSAGYVNCIFCCSKEVPQWGSVHWEPHFLWLGRTGVHLPAAVFHANTSLVKISRKGNSLRLEPARYKKEGAQPAHPPGDVSPSLRAANGGACCPFI